MIIKAKSKKYAIVVFTILFFFTNNASSKTDSLKFAHNFWIGTGKSNFFTSRLKYTSYTVTTLINSDFYNYTFGYDINCRIPHSSVLLSSGINYNLARFGINFRDFVTPNLISSSITQLYKLSYLAVPLKLGFSTKVSTTSSLELGVGLESYFITKFKQIEVIDGVHLWKKDGTSDNSYDVKTDLQKANFVPFGGVTASLKFKMNEGKKVCYYVGLNYYQIYSDFAFIIKSNMLVGGRVFDRTDTIHAEGIRFLLGFTWK